MSGTILQHLESGCLQLLTLLYLDYSRIVSRVPVLQGTGQRSRAYVISSVTPRQDSSTTCLQPDIELYKYTATSRSYRHAPYSLRSPALKSNYECTYPLTCMSLAICRHAELGCTARLSEVTGLSQAVALTRPSVVWLNLQS